MTALFAILGRPDSFALRPGHTSRASDPLECRGSGFFGSLSIDQHRMTHSCWAEVSLLSYHISFLPLALSAAGAGVLHVMWIQEDTL